MSVDRDAVRERIAALERQLAEARARLPRHSTPPRMLIEIEEMEDELAHLQQELERQGGS